MSKKECNFRFDYPSVRVITYRLNYVDFPTVNYRFFRATNISKQCGGFGWIEFTVIGGLIECTVIGGLIEFKVIGGLIEFTVIVGLIEFSHWRVN